MKMGCVVATLLVLGACAAAPGHGEQPALRAVSDLDVERYMGTWHEIAKYPNWFQKNCVSSTYADYSLNPDGTVRVINRCRRDTGQMDEAIGQAHVTGPGTLEVRFAPVWLSWLPFVWGNYWVIDIDTDYQLVAVSEPNREYLWILSRTPMVDAESYQALLKRLQGMGFGLERLQDSKP